MEAVAGLINKGNLSLLKVETFLRRLGPDAVKYIYNPISRATQAFNERKEVSMRRLAKMYPLCMVSVNYLTSEISICTMLGNWRNLTKGTGYCISFELGYRT